MSSLDSLWSLLSEGRDAVTEIPDERWDKSLFLHNNPSEPGKTYTFSAGVLDDIKGFDAAFFGISPREAMEMDPQQRLLLELAWEAMEDAGVPAARLGGTRCGVYVGISATDYVARHYGDVSATGPHQMTGNTLSIAANRISHIFDLRGPSMAIDTACSSSVVALHEACQAIWGGAAETALVGAVHLLLSPLPFIGFSKASMLSKTGRCRAFDAAADGYVRGEGGGFVMIKPLAKALADGDRVHALIAGVRVNTNGRMRGITMSSERGQAELLGDVCDEFGIDPAEIDYAEAHGTGTGIGDPAEAAALGAVYGAARPPEDPLLIGTIKSNIGHLEPASGMAAMMKAILVLKRREAPPSVHFKNPNPKIPFESLNIRVATAVTPVGVDGRPLTVAVNSFGFGGTNAHLVLRECPAEMVRPAARTKPQAPPLYLSTRSAEALVAQAAAAADYLDRVGDSGRYAASRTWALRRDRLAHGLVVYGETAEAVAASLRQFAEDGVADDVATDTASGGPPKVAFVYSGNGSQWQGMGVACYEADQVFKDAVDDVDARLAELTGWSVVEELFLPEEQSRLARTDVAQPLLFAIQIGLTRALADQGLTPDAVVGHSVGEVTAAWASGALTLDQAVQVIYQRSRTQGATHDRGRMMAANLTADDAKDLIEPFDGAIEIGAYNSPTQVTLSGERNAIENLAAVLKEEGVRATILDLLYPFHSRYMDPIESDLIGSLRDLSPSPTATPLISTVTGEAIAGPALGPDHWWKNIREPVRFGPAIETLLKDDFNIFVEIGPRAVLASYTSEMMRAHDLTATPIATCSRKNPNPDSIRNAVGRAWAQGAEIDHSVNFPVAANHADVPSYQWMREPYWLDGTCEADGVLHRERDGALLGWRQDRKLPVWKNELSLSEYPALADHVVGDAVLFPAAGMIEIFLEAARAQMGDGYCAIENLEIHSPLRLDGERTRVLRTILSPLDGRISLYARERMTTNWNRIASARISYIIAEPELEASDANLEGNGPLTSFDPDEIYAIAARLGLDYGPRFRSIKSISIAKRSAWVQLEEPPGWNLPPQETILHPALLDGCLQGLILLVSNVARGERLVGADKTYLPQRVDRAIVHLTGAAPSACHIKLTRISARSITADLMLFDAEDNVIATFDGFRFRLADALRRQQPASMLYHMTAVPMAAAAPPAPPAAPRVVDIQDAAAEAALDEAARSIAASAEGTDAAESLRRALVAHPDRLYEAWALSIKLDSLKNGSALDAALAGDLRSRMLFHGPAAAASLDSVKRAVRQRLRSAVALDLLILCDGGGDLIAQLIQSLPDETVRITVINADADAQAQLGARFETRPRTVITPSAPLEDALEDLEPSAQFDMIVALQSLHGGGAAQELVGQVADKLRGGGLLIAVERAPSDRSDLCLGVTAGGPGEDRAQGAFATADGWRGIFEQAGLSVEGIERLHGDSVITARREASAVSDAAPAPRAAAIAGPVLIVKSQTPPQTRLAEALEVCLVADGLEVAMARTGDAYEHTSANRFRLDPGSAEDWRALLTYLDDSGAGPRTIIDLRHYGKNGKAKAESLKASVWSLTVALRAAAEVLGSSGVRLHIVAGGFGKPSDNTAPALADPTIAALTGVGRVVANEMPKIQLRVNWLDFNGDAAVAAAAFLDAAGCCDEEETTDRADGRWAARLRHGAASSRAGDGAPPARLKLVHQPGSLDEMRWAADVVRDPAADEIEVRVEAAGLNFRDVMFAQGVLPDEALENGFTGPTIGIEAAGEVVRIGARVKRFKPGDRVICFSPSCFSSHVTIKAATAAPLPGGLSYGAGAGICVAFFTVYYSLKALARLAKGDRVLIHGAAGAVGLAAIQYAKHVGAEIYATVGSDSKKAFLRMLGVERIYNSRTLDFAEAIRRDTGGEGVDVVLNSLAGEALRQSVGLLKPFGRFIELGKRDFYMDSPLGLRPFRNNLMYSGVDADQLFKDRPAYAHRLLAQVVKLFEQGVFEPLPHELYGPGQVVDAFRAMQQSKHVGKIVIVPPQPDSEFGEGRAIAAAPRAPLVRRKGTYLITGGLRGVGLEAARLLADLGARRLVLVGRSGHAPEEAAGTIERMKASGVHVLLRACDVADAAAVEAMIAEIDISSAPLRGVIHAAAVYKDEMLGNLTAEAFDSIFASKAGGAIALYDATARKRLDFLIFFSSISTVLGTPGQTSYVAANMVLEALARRGAEAGRNTLAVSFGPIGDAGYLTRNREVADVIEDRLGSAPMRSIDAMAMLMPLIGRATGHVIIADFAPGKLLRKLPGAKAHRFDDVMIGAAADGADGGEDVLAIIQSLSEEEAHAFIRDRAVIEIAKVLKMAPEKISLNKSMEEIGIDSLLAVEFLLGLERDLGVDILDSASTDAPSLGKMIDGIVDIVIARTRGDGPLDVEERRRGEIERLMTAHSVGSELEKLSEIEDSKAKQRVAG